MALSVTTPAAAGVGDTVIETVAYFCTASGVAATLGLTVILALAD